MNTATGALIEAQSGAYTALADRIWGYVELGYEEQQSCTAHIDALKRQGFPWWPVMPFRPARILGNGWRRAKTV